MSSSSSFACYNNNNCQSNEMSFIKGDMAMFVVSSSDASSSACLEDEMLDCCPSSSFFASHTKETAAAESALVSPISTRSETCTLYGLPLPLCKSVHAYKYGAPASIDTLTEQQQQQQQEEEEDSCPVEHFEDDDTPDESMHNDDDVSALSASSFDRCVDCLDNIEMELAAEMSQLSPERYEAIRGAALFGLQILDDEEEPENKNLYLQTTCQFIDSARGA